MAGGAACTGAAPGQGSLAASLRPSLSSTLASPGAPHGRRRAKAALRSPPARHGLPPQEPARAARPRLAGWPAGRQPRPSPFPPSLRGKQLRAPYLAPPHTRSISGRRTTPVRRVGKRSHGGPPPTCVRPARRARPSPARACVRRAVRFVPQPAVGSCSRGRGGAWAAAHCRRLPATPRGTLSRRPRRLRTMGPEAGREGRGEKQGGRCAAPLRRRRSSPADRRHHAARPPPPAVGWKPRA